MFDDDYILSLSYAACRKGLSGKSPGRPERQVKRRTGGSL